MQRVLAAVQGSFADRRAVSLTLSLFGAGLTRCPLPAYFSDPAAYARGQSAVKEQVQPDILFGPFALPLYGQAFGSQVHYLKDQAPNLARPVLSDIVDLDTLQPPSLDTQPNLLFFREAVRKMSEEHKEETPVAAIALAPSDLPIMLMGLDGWMQTILFDENGAQAMMAMAAAFFVPWANALLEAGAAFIVMPLIFANPSMITRPIAHQWVFPVLKECFSKVNGPLVIHSGGAPLTPFLDLFTDLPNVAAFVLNKRENLKEARQRAGHNKTLIGTIEGPDLVNRDPESIFQECLKVLTEHHNDPYFILGSTGADIHPATPLANLQVIQRAAQQAA